MIRLAVASLTLALCAAILQALHPVGFRWAVMFFTCAAASFLVLDWLDDPRRAPAVDESPPVDEPAPAPVDEHVEVHVSNEPGFTPTVDTLSARIVLPTTIAAAGTFTGPDLLTHRAERDVEPVTGPMPRIDEPAMTRVRPYLDAP